MNRPSKTILVTGGAGFIGSHLCDKLIELRFDVICLDNFYTGSRENIRHLLSSNRFKLIKQDVTEPIQLKADAIFHLACPASPVHYQRNPVPTLRCNILGTLNMLEMARCLGVPMIFTSTSEVYGDPQIHPQPEHYWGHVNPIGPRACYDEGKRCAETFCMDYHRQFGTDVRIARIFNTYGPRMAVDDGRVISNFIVQALREEPITIHGDGNQTRSFQYVDDLIRGLLALFAAEPLTGPINLGNPEEYTIKDLARLIRERVASKSKIEHKPLPTDDPRQRQPDIRMAREKLHWSPQVILEEGLQRTIAYFKNKL